MPKIIPNPTPKLPGNIGIGEGKPPIDVSKNFDGALGIIPDFQASILVNALKRKQGTDLLSAPRVTVMNGTQATITVAQEFIYPTDYQPAPVPGGAGGGGGFGGLGGGVGRNNNTIGHAIFRYRCTR